MAIMSDARLTELNWSNLPEAGIQLEQIPTYPTVLFCGTTSLART